MKQNLKIGNMVDDGSGDYLRAGGLKLNNNFDELYQELGDGSVPYPAGAWRTYNASEGHILKAEWGKSYAIDTTVGLVTVELPKGTVNDYNKVIKARDVFSVWNLNPVTFTPANGDTIKGSPNSVEINTALSDVQLVYCAPGRWEYIPNQQISRINSSDIANVARKDFIVEVEGQTDFLDIFNGTKYNAANTQVYQRGNILLYGETFTDNSDYGSISTDPLNPDAIVPLNGSDIRLRKPCNVGDVVTVITFMDAISQWRSTYSRRQITLWDSKMSSKESLQGAYLVTDLSALKTISLFAFDIPGTEPVNPNSLEVMVNGIIQNQAGTAGLPLLRCEGADADNNTDCVALGGTWQESFTDYLLIRDDNNIPTDISFDRKFEHGDIITLTWYNNDIGTLLELDEIIDETDNRYISQGGEISITGDVAITDFDNPGWPNVEAVPTSSIAVTNPYVIFNLVYPIGTIYENAVNPNNPATYMGFGSWKLWGQGKVLAGWNNDNTDPNFALNNNDLDVNNNPSHTAGGTGGTTQNTLTNNNLPATKTDEKVLIADDNGPIIIGGCQVDPDDQGPVYTKYKEDHAVTNGTHEPPLNVNNLQPYVTVYRWMRIA